MLRVRIVIALNLLAASLFLFGCNTCDGVHPSGEINDNGFVGSYYFSVGQPGEMKLNMALQKASLAKGGALLLLAMDTPENWSVVINGKRHAPNFVFSELSNTMNPHHNMVFSLPVSRDIWRKEDNQINLSFNSSKGSFKASVEPESISCFIKTLHAI